MRSTLFTFLILLLMITLQISCEKEIKHGDPQVSISYIDSLHEQAYQLKDSSKIDAALHTNYRALRLIENRSDSALTKILRQRIVLFGNKRSLDSALIYANKLFSLYQKSKDSFGMADAMYLKGFYFNKSNQKDSALINAYQSVELYKQLKDSSKVYSRAKLLTLILQTLGNYEEAELTAVESLTFLTDKSDKEELSRTYNYIAILTKSRGNFNEALYWYEKALELTTDKHHRNNIRNNIALVQIELQNFKIAFDILSDLRADSIHDFSKDLRYKSRILNNWAFAKSKLGHTDAESYLLQALAMRKQNNIAYRLNGSYIRLAEHYADRLDPKAVNMAKLAYQTAKTYNNPDDQLAALSILIETAKEPREYAILYRDLSDSIYRVRQRSKNHYAKIKYDVEYNRQENKNLKANALIQELQVSKAQSRNFYLILIFIFTVTGFYLLYRGLKRKHLQEKEIAAYQAELYISKKVHDEIANDVFNLLTRTQNDALNTPFKSFLLSAIDNLYRKTRNIARDFSDIPVGIEFKDTLADLLSNYSNKDTQILNKGVKDIPWENISEDKQRALYRILQELLINMKKHSQASLIMINLKMEGTCLTVRYSDNGIGTTKESLTSGHGIKNMQQRLKTVKGEINYDHSEGPGTKATITIPI